MSVCVCEEAEVGSTFLHGGYMVDICVSVCEYRWKETQMQQEAVVESSTLASFSHPVCFRSLHLLISHLPPRLTLHCRCCKN